MNLKTLSTQAIPLADIVSSQAPRRFGGQRFCSLCPAELTSYNPLEICNRCQRKILVKFLAETGTVVSPKVAYRTRSFPIFPRRRELPRSTPGFS